MGLGQTRLKLSDSVKLIRHLEVKDLSWMGLGHTLFKLSDSVKVDPTFGGLEVKELSWMGLGQTPGTWLCPGHLTLI